MLDGNSWTAEPVRAWMYMGGGLEDSFHHRCGGQNEEAGEGSFQSCIPVQSESNPLAQARDQMEQHGLQDCPVDRNVAGAMPQTNSLIRERRRVINSHVKAVPTQAPIETYHDARS